MPRKKNSFRICVYFNTYEGKNEKRSIAKKLRNGLESIRDAKINKKLETLKKKNGFLSSNRGVYICMDHRIIYIYML